MEETMRPRPTNPQRRHLAAASEPFVETGAEPIGQVVLELRDAPLMYVVDDVHARINSLLETGPHTVVVDISRVGQVSSTTIAALLWVKRCCSARGVEMRVRRPSRRSRDTLERTGLLDTLTLETMSTATDGIPGPRR